MSETVECIECGDEVSENDATYGAGSVSDSGLDQLEQGMSVGLGEVFEYDDGPYCGFDCLLSDG